jgi:hypothetical protein
MGLCFLQANAYHKEVLAVSQRQYLKIGLIRKLRFAFTVHVTVSTAKVVP